ncbi:MAG: hypothetical protein AAF736_12145 [Pseudomonadota bacterium]
MITQTALALLLLPGQSTWQPQGPAPISGGQVENVVGSPVAGAVNALAPHPENPDVLFIGSVNGGIWRTTSATALVPQWEPLTDDQPSQSIGSIRFDPTDATRQTLVASIARTSAFNTEGGSRSGALRTTDGGDTWVLLDGLAGRNLVAVEASGDVLLAASDGGDSGTCEDLGLFRSVDAGLSWEVVDNGLPVAVIEALGRDPVDPDVLYAAVLLASLCQPEGQNGLYRSEDFGQSWVKVSPPAAVSAIDTLLEDVPGSHAELAVGRAGNVFAALVPGSTRRLEGVFFSGDGGDTWLTLDLPGSFEPSFRGVNPGRQGFIHLSLAADPQSANIVYVGGDRQPQNDAGEFPNSIGATDFSGRLFRGDVSQPAGFQWTALTHAGTFAGSSPHADSREMAFDAAGSLLQVDDGGVYRQSAPRGFFGDWFSLNGNLQITETHDGALDVLANVALGGNQDNGSTQQVMAGQLEWETVNAGDGGDVAVAVMGPESIRFHSFAFFGRPTRSVYLADNSLQSRTELALAPVSKSPELVGQFNTPVAVNRDDPMRLLIGAENGLFESVDQGDTIRQLVADVVPTGLLGNPLIFGAPGAADLIYAAGCNGPCGASQLGQVWLRRPGDEEFQSIYTGQDAGGITAIAAGPDAEKVFVMERSRIIELRSFGDIAFDVSGDLASLDPGRFRSLLWVAGDADAALLAGTDRGVYVAFESGGFEAWSRVGAGIPQSPVFDLDVDPARDRVLASTMGRGSYSLDGLLQRLPRIFASGFE